MSSRPKTWSAWQCVINNASSRSIFSRSACWRKSAETSMTMRRSTSSTAVSTIRPVRRRLSRGSSDRQTSQSHPIIGTPTDVPVPRKVIRIGNGERGLRIADCGFMSLFNRGREIEIESCINPQSAIRNPQSAIPSLRVSRFARAGAQFGGDVVQTNVAFDHQDQQMVKQVADFGRELFAAFVIAGVLRRDDRLGGFLADFLEYLVEAAVEQVARVGAFGALVLPLLDKFDEVLKLYP